MAQRQEITSHDKLNIVSEMAVGCCMKILCKKRILIRLPTLIVSQFD